MNKYRRLREDDEDRIILPRFANKEGDVNLLRMAKDVEKRKQTRAEERKRAERRAFYRKKYANIFDGIERLDNANDQIDFLFEKLVPKSGPAETKAGELVRALTKIMYRDYNDGDIFYAGYGVETAAPAAEYLYQNTNSTIQSDINNIVKKELQGEAYTSALEKIAEHLIDFLQQNLETIATPNEDDMLDCEPNNVFDGIVLHEFDCDFGEFTNDLLYENNRGAIREIESRLDDFTSQYTSEGRVTSWARDAYTIENLDIIELGVVERQWDKFARDLEDYLEYAYSEGEDDGEDW